MDGDAADAGRIRHRLQGGAGRGQGKGPTGGGDRSGWADGSPSTQPNLRLLPAFPCETAPQASILGADATTRGLHSPMSAGQAIGQDRSSRSVLLTSSTYVSIHQCRG